MQFMANMLPGAMESSDHSNLQLRADVEELRSRFPRTQDLYREVSGLLFFRYGITPTANRLYQLVRKGSMSAPTEALQQFWATLREKSRIRIEHPDLPEDLRDQTAELLHSIWSKARAEALASFAELKDAAEQALGLARAAEEKALAANRETERRLADIRDSLENEREAKRGVEQKLAAEIASRASAVERLEALEKTNVQCQNDLTQARKDFSAELDNLRGTLQVRERHFEAAEARSLAEIQRERQVAEAMRTELGDARALKAESDRRSTAEHKRLQEEISKRALRIGQLEGELHAVVHGRDKLAEELSLERTLLRECEQRVAAALREADAWQNRALAAHKELDALHKARQKKLRKSPTDEQLDLGR